MKESATKAGLDTKNKQITNHSSRATAVSTLSKFGAGEQEIMKITGHANPNSIKPYLQLDDEHHEKLIKKMRTDQSSSASNIKPCDPIPGPSNISKLLAFFRFTPSQSSSHPSHTIVSSQSESCTVILPESSDQCEIAAMAANESRSVTELSGQSANILKKPDAPESAKYLFNNCTFNNVSFN